MESSDYVKAHQFFEYCKDSGRLSWRHSEGPAFETLHQWRCRKPYFGKSAGYKSSGGYFQVRFLGKRVLLHRLVWMMVSGDWPECEIDHINGDRSDNRIDNLREATRQENCQNIISHELTGAHWDERAGKWRAVIKYYGQHKYLGLFESRGEAVEAYKCAKAKHHLFSPAQRLP